MIKLLAVDVDGTLLDDDKNISDEFRYVFDKILEKNIIFVIASGRSYVSLMSTFPYLVEDAVFIAENGAHIVYKNEVLYFKPLQRDTSLAIIKEAEKIPGTAILYKAKEMIYIKKLSDKIMEKVLSYLPVFEVVEDFETIEQAPIEIAVFDEYGAQDNCYRVLNELKYPGIKIVVTGYSWVDIMDKDTDKGTAINLIKKRFSIGYDECAAFGDNYNDIELLQNVYHSYAMKNAYDDIRKIARYVTEKNNNEHGAVHEIKMLLDI